MNRRLIAGLALIAMAVACGEATLTSSGQPKSSSKKTDGNQADVIQATSSKTLQSKSTASSTVVKSEIKPGFALAQALEVAQFGSQTVDVTVQGRTPSGSLELQPSSLAGFTIEYLTSAGEPLTGSIDLDAEAKASFKLRLSSDLTPVDGIVRAPGAGPREMTLQGTDAGQPVSNTVTFKTTNAALIPMNVNAVKALPARFEFPAGTIPVFVNPADRVVVRVMHFGGGSYRHQNQNGSMAAGRGYCPLNTDTSIQVDPAQPLPAACLPCPADAVADVTGNFYDHNNENSNDQRAIVCLKK
ncbi:MAG: hypothetical protein RJB13_2139 [Pseudomonadota bacterium]